MIRKQNDSKIALATYRLVHWLFGELTKSFGVKVCGMRYSEDTFKHLCGKASISFLCFKLIYNNLLSNVTVDDRFKSFAIRKSELSNYPIEDFGRQNEQTDSRIHIRSMSNWLLTTKHLNNLSNFIWFEYRTDYAMD